MFNYSLMQDVDSEATFRKQVDAWIWFGDDGRNMFAFVTVIKQILTARHGANDVANLIEQVVVPRLKDLVE